MASRLSVFHKRLHDPVLGQTNWVVSISTQGVSGPQRTSGAFRTKKEAVGFARLAARIFSPSQLMVRNTKGRVSSRRIKEP